MNDNNGKTKLHEGRDDLTGEYKWGDAGQLVLFFIFIAVWIIDSFFSRTSTFFAEYVHWIIRVLIAAQVLIFSFIISRNGLKIVFNEVRETPEVIRKGVFGIIRHPIYLGAILLYLGLIITTFSLFAVVVWIIILVFYYIIARYEEKVLVERFGDDYREYMKDVPMLVPRIFK